MSIIMEMRAFIRKKRATAIPRFFALTLSISLTLTPTQIKTRRTFGPGKLGLGIYVYVAELDSMPTSQNVLLSFS